eukprot:s3996_g2.t1
MTQVLKIAACLWSCAAEDSEPWLGRWSPLMRRDAGSSALLEHSRDLDTVPEPPDLSLHFAHEELVTCDMEEADAFWQTHPFRRNAEKMQTQLAAMRGLREIKRIFATQSLPLIVVGDLLLGWRRGCLASATAATVSVATFGPWLQELGLNTLEKAFRTHGLELDTSRCPHGPLMAGCRLSGHLRRSDGSLTTLQLGVLLSPPPAMVGRRPGFFPRCAAGCGSTCERCRLAWPQPSKDMLSVKDITFPEVKSQPSLKPDLIDFVDDMPCWDTSGKVKDKDSSSPPAKESKRTLRAKRRQARLEEFLRKHDFTGIDSPGNIN